MALVLANRVQETSTTTGTGTLTLAGAVLGYQTFSAGIGVGNTCYYAITSSTGAWEVGIGTVGAGTLARTTLLSSSTGSLVSFTGTLNVYVTYPSEKSVNLDASNIITGYPITVADSVFTLQDNIDPTKQAQFQLSPLATGTTVTYTMPLGIGGAATLADLQTSQTFSGVKSFSAASLNLGSSVVASTVNMAYGATTTGLTKTVNIGTGGLSGSTTAITVGSANGSTTTMLGTTVIGGASGNQSLQVNNVASAVDYLQVSGNSGGYPSLSAQGASANVSIVYGTKGAGGHNFTTNGLSVNQFVVSHTATAVNYAQVSGAVTGSPVIITAQGSDTNVSLAYAPKGTGRHTFYSNSGTQFVVGNTATAVNYVQTDGAATGAAPTISAQGSDANISLALSAKGTGNVTILPTGTNVNTFKISQGYYNTLSYFGVTGTGGFAGVQYNATPASGGVSHVFTANGSPTAQGQNLLAINSAAAGGVSVNYLGTYSNTTGNAPELSAQGSDANINLKLTPKGTGGVQFTGPLLPNNLAGTSGQVLTSAGAGAVPTWATPVSSNITAQGLYENSATISANYTIGTGNNAVSAGPITINSGIVVTVPSGSTWVIV